MKRWKISHPVCRIPYPDRILPELGIPFFFLFLFIPRIPLFTGPMNTRRCPVCGWETAGSERFCPYDASPLDDSVNSETGKE